MMGEADEPLIDIEVAIMSETNLAYKVFDGKVEVWLPKSQCQNNLDGSFTMPRWLAIERDLV